VKVERLAKACLVVAPFPHHLAYGRINKKLMPCLPLALLKGDAPVIEISLPLRPSQFSALSLNALPDVLELVIRVEDMFTIGTRDGAQDEQHSDK
jgi:hypothetical protein